MTDLSFAERSRLSNEQAHDKWLAERTAKMHELFCGDIDNRQRCQAEPAGNFEWPMFASRDHKLEVAFYDRKGQFMSYWDSYEFEEDGERVFSLIMPVANASYAKIRVTHLPSDSVLETTVVNM